MPSQFKIVTPSSKCIDLICSFEGLFLKAYKDPVGIPTIGYGTIMYPNSARVKMGENCTKQEAYDWLDWEVKQKAGAVRAMLSGVKYTQSMFDALVSFAYNLGVGALQKSTLLKKVKANPNDNSIRDEFMKWVNAGGKPLAGLIRRRKAEADLYFS